MRRCRLTCCRSEFLGEQASEYFWRFIDAVKGPVPTNETQVRKPRPLHRGAHSSRWVQEYHDILRVAGSLLTPLKTEMLKVALHPLHLFTRHSMRCALDTTARVWKCIVRLPQRRRACATPATFHRYVSCCALSLGAPLTHSLLGICCGRR